MVCQQAIDKEVEEGKKPYKVMIRMLEKNELDEYSDMGLYDPN